ncbi:hypothetical protein [Fibrobacter sp.]
MSGRLYTWSAAIDSAALANDTESSSDKAKWHAYRIFNMYSVRYVKD